MSVLGGAWSRPSRANYQDRVANAQGDGESLLNFLARHPSTARNIATKLVRRFVSDAPQPALVDRLAATYLSKDTAIAPVLRQLFLSAEFNAAVGQKVQRPQDWLYAALRTTRAQIDPSPKGVAATRLRSAAQAIGQPLFERVSPDGWPDRATYWVAADGLLKRWEHGAKLARNLHHRRGVAREGRGRRHRAAPVAAAERPCGTSWSPWRARRSSSTCPPADADAIAAAARLTPTGPASTLTGDLVLLQNAVGLLLAHPTFQRR